MDVETDYMLVFACLLSASFAIIFPWFVTSFLITHLATLIVPGKADFVINIYLPVIHRATLGLRVT